jgi:hypothetical protein
VICELPGYYTFELDSTVIITEGTEFFVQIKYDSKNTENKWPIAVEDTIATYSMPHIETGKFWVAPNPEIWPTAWYQVGHGTAFSYDLCIKAYSKQLPAPPDPDVFAGEDATIIEGNAFEITGANAQNYSAIQWSTAGDGFFADEFTLTTAYYPGVLDIAAGSVDLILAAFALPPSTAVVTDTFTLTVLRYPSVEIIFPENNQKVCDSQIALLGSAFDPDGDLMMVEISINNTAWLPVSGLESWTFEIELNQGLNTLKARAVDSAGLVTESGLIEIICSIQEIFLPKGWSVISGFLLPDQQDIGTLLESIAENLVIIQSQDGLYAPSLNIQTLEQWDSSVGYKIKMLDDDYLTFCGDLPLNNTIGFTAGFHIIPYLSNVSWNIDQLFADPANDILYIFDLTDLKIYWPQMEINTLSTLHPGKGYQARFLNPVTITYPDIVNFSFSDVSPDRETNIRPVNDFFFPDLNNVIKMNGLTKPIQFKNPEAGK